MCSVRAEKASTRPGTGTDCKMWVTHRLKQRSGEDQGNRGPAVRPCGISLQLVTSGWEEVGRCRPELMSCTATLRGHWGQARSMRQVPQAPQQGLEEQRILEECSGGDPFVHSQRIHVTGPSTLHKTSLRPGRSTGTGAIRESRTLLSVLVAKPVCKTSHT